MLAFAPALTVVFLLASQVSAFTFNVTFGTQQLNATQILPSLPLPDPMTSCNDNCTKVNSEIAACNNDAACLCSNQTVADLLVCEQCMYQSLIAANKPLPDPKAGSTPILAGYTAACTASNQTLLPKALALTVPTFWDGNFGQEVPLVGLIFTVGTGAFLGVGSIVLLSNL